MLDTTASYVFVTQKKVHAHATAAALINFCEGEILMSKENEMVERRGNLGP